MRSGAEPLNIAGHSAMSLARGFVVHRHTRVTSDYVVRPWRIAMIAKIFILAKEIRAMRTKKLR
jgi:hypothetical protein